MPPGFADPEPEGDEGTEPMEKGELDPGPDTELGDPDIEDAFAEEGYPMAAAVFPESSLTGKGLDIGLGFKVGTRIGVVDYSNSLLPVDGHDLLRHSGQDGDSGPGAGKLY